MERATAKDLDLWIQGRGRKPLVLGGARQVGKTWLVRDLATRSKLDLVEINFERDPRLAKVFQQTDPAAVISDLSIALEREIDSRRSLLFLDEIQTAGEVLARLRTCRPLCADS